VSLYLQLRQDAEVAHARGEPPHTIGRVQKLTAAKRHRARVERRHLRLEFNQLATASAISSGVVGRDGLSAFVAMGPVGATVMATGRGASNAAMQSSLVLIDRVASGSGRYPGTGLTPAVRLLRQSDQFRQYESAARQSVDGDIPILGAGGTGGHR
jgi:hypothetical protein